MLSYLLASFIGLSLGLLGGGGSILTVPILVYILKIDPKTSIALSLAIVGVTSSFGVLRHYKNGNINLKTASIFAPIAMLGTFSGARISQYLPGQFQLILFAIVMLAASIAMFKERKNTEEKAISVNYFTISIIAIGVGILTGIVGVGGGFLIVPALVLLAGISMKDSVGTSLFIISLNSLSGFLGYIGSIEIPWFFLFEFTSFSVVGIFLGASLVKFVSQAVLKKTFAIFLIVMGLFILYKNKSILITSSVLSSHFQKFISQSSI